MAEMKSDHMEVVTTFNNKQKDFFALLDDPFFRKFGTNVAGYLCFSANKNWTLYYPSNCLLTCALNCLLCSHGFKRIAKKKNSSSASVQMIRFSFLYVWNDSILTKQRTISVLQTKSSVWSYPGNCMQTQPGHNKLDKIAENFGVVKKVSKVYSGCSARNCTLIKF